MRTSLALLFLSIATASHAQSDRAPERIAETKTGGGKEASVEEWMNQAALLLQDEPSQEDADKGLQWLKKAADAGNPLALFKLGVFYSEGRIVPLDYEEAKNCYERSARMGFALAQHNLGGMYVSARGVKRDWVEGLAWLIIAKKRGVDDGALDQTREYLESRKKGAAIEAGEARAVALEAELGLAASETKPEHKTPALVITPPPRPVVKPMKIAPPSPGSLSPTLELPTRTGPAK